MRLSGFFYPIENIVQISQYLVERPLFKVMKFLGISLDQVVNDPIAKNKVLGYYKLYRDIQRTMGDPELLDAKDMMERKIYWQEICERLGP